MRKLSVLILSLFTMVLSFATTIKGKVIKVADGDTITIIEENGDKTRIRLYGIDAPEKKQDYGIKSLDVLKKLIDKKEVEIDVKDKDRYGRVVGIVYYNGMNINLYMLKTGNAWWYKQYSKHNAEFRIAEEKARLKKLGLWKESNPTPPWVYRKEKKK
ncbi:thermonuclease family protein [Cetobacterium sp. 2A]|uniref:thermonuclease family protein n=1 Tax=Cetobacterium sp. 2A TaxID=2754723 RepID=UPI00163CAFEA|nr:thermonuclease family protein [Cetobacterium sp. 2A]MBC2856984.1 thermonuclease family protein [Cetobacterium sp. 2A]